MKIIFTAQKDCALAFQLCIVNKQKHIVMALINQNTIGQQPQQGKRNMLIEGILGSFTPCIGYDSDRNEMRDCNRKV